MEISRVIVRSNEQKVLPYVWLNGENQEVAVQVRLVGERASLLLVGIFLGRKNHSLVFNTHVIHEAPHTKSLTHLRGVFSDRSSFSNDGMIHIEKGAKGADGFFASKVLLFDDAKGRSVPALEIDENDLKAGHASTVGRPDENQMFYLRSRGLSEKEAENLIVSGFFEPTIALLPESTRQEVRAKLNAKL